MVTVCVNFEEKIITIHSRPTSLVLVIRPIEVACVLEFLNIGLPNSPQDDKGGSGKEGTKYMV